MKLVGLMPCRNEAWVIGYSLRAALTWCDEVVVLDHASTDESLAIVHGISQEYPGRVVMLVDVDPVWREMAHRQALLDVARERGATHLAIVDADEVLTANIAASARLQIQQLPNGAYFQLPMRNMWRSADQYRSDNSIWGSAITTLAFCDSRSLRWASTNGYDHHHREPHGSRLGMQWPSRKCDGGVMHLQFTNWRRLVSKHALYKMIEVIRWPDRKRGHIDQMYSQALDEAGLRTAPAPDGWHHKDFLQYLDLDAEPWQEAECKRLWAEHGEAKFQGLNLFGVV